jgi:hypothetical protein
MYQASEVEQFDPGHEAMPLVGPSEPVSRGIGDPRLIGATARENRPSDASELVGERDCQHVAVQPPRCLLNPRPQAPHRRTWAPHQHDVCGLHEQRSQVLVAALGELAQYGAISRRLCFGTSPSQAPKSRPCLKPAPLPIAANTALEMIGPTPGTVISL